MKARRATRIEERHAQLRWQAGCGMCGKRIDGARRLAVTMSSAKGGTVTEMMCEGCALDLLGSRATMDPGPKLPGVE